VDEGTWLEVTGGLVEGDDIVIAGIDGLADGVTVRVVRDTNPYSGKVDPPGPDSGLPSASASATTAASSGAAKLRGLTRSQRTPKDDVVMWLTRLALRNPILILMIP